MRSLILLLAFASAFDPGFVHALELAYHGFKTKVPTKPDTEERIPLIQTAETSCAFAARELGKPPEWENLNNALTGFFQVFYEIESEEGPTGYFFGMDIGRGGAEYEGAVPTANQFTVQCDKFEFRLLFDADRDGRIRPSEIRPAEIIPWIEGRAFTTERDPWGGFFAEFDVPESRGPARVALNLRLGCLYYSRFGWGVKEPMTARPGAGAFRGVAKVPLPLAAETDWAGEARQLALQPVNGIPGSILVLDGVKLLLRTAGPRREGSPEWRAMAAGRVFPLDAALPFGEKWRIIKEVAPDLSSIVLAEPEEEAAKIFTGRVGEPLPDWARTDVTTRDVISPARMLGKEWILAEVRFERNKREPFAEIAELAGQIRAQAGKPIEIVFFQDGLDLENYYAATKDATTLPYRLIEGFRNYGENSNGQNAIRNLLLQESGQLTLIIDETGRVIFRRSQPVLELRSEIIDFLRGK